MGCRLPALRLLRCDPEQYTFSTYVAVGRIAEFLLHSPAEINTVSGMRPAGPTLNGNPDMVRVFIPASLRQFTGGVRDMDLDVITVREAIDELDRRFPGLRSRLCAGDRLKPGIAVAVDSRISERGLLEGLSGAKELHFLPSVSGG